MHLKDLCYITEGGGWVCVSIQNDKDILTNLHFSRVALDPNYLVLISALPNDI